LFEYKQWDEKTPLSPRIVPAGLASIREALRQKLYEQFSSSTDTEDSDGYGFSTDHSTPPSSVEKDPAPIATLLPPTPSKAPLDVPKKVKKPKPELQPVLSYQKGKYDTPTSIYDKPRTKISQHEHLTQNLIPYYATDSALANDLPDVTNRGIHVFLDMSNINISFQASLREKYNLSESDRFYPLPQLNLDFLTEILIRGRKTQGLTAGCSVHPGKPDPHFVSDLRTLTYRVDLRERKRTTEPKKGYYSSSDEANRPPRVRYVEDLVDETLQTRIAESVMEHFSNPGTLVIATGDAKPAPFSDGFWVYADRALKMGWNVEVVSWRSSLSGAWRDVEWKKQWGGRFRVIELDGFLDDLLCTLE